MTLRFVDSFARLGLEGDLKQPRGFTHTFFEEVDRCATGRKIYGESVDLHDRYSAPRLVRMRICHRNKIATKLCKFQTACSRRSVPTDGRARTVERMSVEDAAQPSRGRPNAHMIMPFGETSMTNDVTAEDEAKQRFVDQVDALNLRAQIDGPDPDSAARMKAVIADHKRRCAALASAEAEARPDRGEPQRLGS